MKKLPAAFYRRDNVVAIAEELIGKILVTAIDGCVTSGRIVETEAYKAFADKASHSYNGKRTARNEHMYHAGASVYVYICYGMYHLMNVVTNEKDIPEAVLIRALEPLTGIEVMAHRCNKKITDAGICRGPGNLARAMGIDKSYSGINLCDDMIYILDDRIGVDEIIFSSPRIGVEGAGEDAGLPYRFYIKGNKFVSGRPR